jgi:hypothetical protein
MRRAPPLPALTLLFLLCSCGSVSAASAPELPRQRLGPDLPAPARHTLRVAAGGDLQGALDRAAPGDVIALDHRAVFVGPFTLPRKSGSDWITLRTDTPDSGLPTPGQRVTPANSPQLAQLVSDGLPIFRADAGAHHYRLLGLELRPTSGTRATALVELGNDSMSTAELPHHFVFTHCYLHGDPVQGTRRGLALNSAWTAVLDSWLSDFKESGADSQAIAGWSGPGPFLIAGNWLEAAGEDLLFGGSDPPSRERIPADIEIRGNRFSRPPSWRDPSITGQAWTIKNLLELKNARRVLIRDNLFEHNWVAAQSGFAILFTVRNQNGGAPWSVVEDVTFEDNVVRRTASAISVLGLDDSQPGRSGRTSRVAIRNNLFQDVGGSWGGAGTLFQILNGSEGVTIEHNSAFQSGNVIMADGAQHHHFVFRENLVAHNQYGIVGTGTGIGAATLGAYFPGAVVTGNVFIGGEAGRYPPGNFFPTTLDAVFAALPAPHSPLASMAQAGARGLDELASQE